MNRLPSVSSRKLIKFLSKEGFVNTRRRGSHFFFVHKDGRTTVVPVHSRKTIGKGLLNEILKDINMSREEFSKKF